MKQTNNLGHKLILYGYKCTTALPQTFHQVSQQIISERYERERETLDRDRERDVDQQIHNKSKPQTKKQQQQALSITTSKKTKQYILKTSQNKIVKAY